VIGCFSRPLTVPRWLYSRISCLLACRFNVILTDCDQSLGVSPRLMIANRTLTRQRLIKSTGRRSPGYRLPSLRDYEDARLQNLRLAVTTGCELALSS
jgi:hypothetical protein